MRSLLLFLNIVFLISCASCKINSDTKTTINQNPPIEDFPDPPYGPYPNEEFTSFSFFWDITDQNLDSIKLERKPISTYCYKTHLSDLQIATPADPNKSPLFIFKLYDSNQNILSQNQISSFHGAEAIFPYSKKAYSVKVFLLNQKTQKEFFLREEKILSSEEIKKQDRFAHIGKCYVLSQF